MADLLQRLKALENPIRVGITGIGSIGKGLLLQARLTPGIHPVVIVDILLDHAVSWAQVLQFDYQVVDSLEAMHSAIRAGKLAVCQDGELAARCELVDVFIEGTSSVPAGGRNAITALEHGKHLVMMNYEADLMFGPYLNQLARQQGRVYTSADGDQPTVLRRIIHEMEFMGFKLVMAGNIKGFLDRYANPTSIIPEADKRKLDHKMCASYTDGTKLGVEMAVLANALDLHVSVPGMAGPRIASIYDVFDCFDFASLWDGEHGLVDYVLGAKPTGGVFAIGYTDIPHQMETLEWFPPRMGPGPFYLFYRPYHLGHFEAMLSVAEAALDGSGILRPEAGFQTNVYAYAKRDLRLGETLDGIGGYDCYGLVENCAGQRERPGLPICIAEDVRLKRDIPRDSRILLEDVIYDPQEFQFRLYELAQRILPSGTGRSQVEKNE